MSRKMLRAFVCAVIIFTVSLGAFATERVRLATTTSAYETGLLDEILPPFEERFDVKVDVIAVGTGKALKLAENGDADLVLVHAPALEKKFVEAGFGVNRRAVMYNDFVIVGPKEDPAAIKGLKAKEAFSKIYETQSVFVSRGDESGTHQKEKGIWKKLGVMPNGSWYVEAGSGMSQGLRIADEKGAYCLIDRATFINLKSTTRLIKLVEGDKSLLNFYSVIVTSPYTHDHAKYLLSMALVGWFTSTSVQKQMEDFRQEGEVLFYPNAHAVSHH